MQARPERLWSPRERKHMRQASYAVWFSPLKAFPPITYGVEGKGRGKQQKAAIFLDQMRV
jgi:hypothetical protein